MIKVIDQMNNIIRLDQKPKRIISLVPSQTELLYDLGLNSEVVGITKFCIHPKSWFKNKTRVGGTKTVNLKKIKELNPDLIIANKEENEQNQIEALQKEFPVFISNIYNISDSLEMINKVGDLTETATKANEISSTIQSGFAKLEEFTIIRKTCLYFIWREPYMACGKDTFVNDMLNRCGFNNLLDGRYPEVNIEVIQKLNPEYILLSSEPYPFKQKHIDELQTKVPNSKIRLVDGELFSWYGSRLVKSPEYFKQFIAL